jgi:hypothetical protein
MGIQTNGDTNGWIDTLVDGHSEMEMNMEEQIDRRIDLQTSEHAYRLIDRQMD